MTSSHYLNVIVKSAKELKPTNFRINIFNAPTSDPFCTLHLTDLEEKNSQVVKETITPVWNEKLQFALPDNPDEETLFVTVWGKHLIGRNTFIGRVEIPICLVIDKKEDGKGYVEKKHVSKWFKLLGRPGNLNEKVTGWVELDFSYTYIPTVDPNTFMPIANPNQSLHSPAPQPINQFHIAQPPTESGPITYPQLAPPIDTSSPMGYTNDPSQPPVTRFQNVTSYQVPDSVRKSSSLPFVFQPNDVPADLPPNYMSERRSSVPATQYQSFTPSPLSGNPSPLAVQSPSTSRSQSNSFQNIPPALVPAVNQSYLSMSTISPQVSADV